MVAAFALGGRSRSDTLVQLHTIQGCCVKCGSVHGVTEQELMTSVKLLVIIAISLLCVVLAFTIVYE